MGETLTEPARIGQGRRSNRPGKLSGKRTSPGEGLWREVRIAASAEGITISGERTEGASCGAVSALSRCRVTSWMTAPEDGGDMDETDVLEHLPLRALHEELGGSFVPFAGWEMPVRYGPGVMAEHLWCREKAGLFDVSHMGQVMLPADAGEALEALFADGCDRPAGGSAALCVLHQCPGRAARRPDDRAPRRGAAPCRQRGLCGDRYRPSRKPCARCAGPVRSRASGAAGADGGDGAGAACVRRRGAAFHGCGAAALGGCRSVDIAVGLYRRRRVRDFAAGRGGGGFRPGASCATNMWRRSGWARGIRCVSRPDCRFTGRTSGRRSRRWRPA